MGQTLTEKLANLLKKTDMTITGIARKAQVSRQYLYDIMSGRVLTVNYDLAKNIANAMNINFIELREGNSKGVKIPVLGVIPAGIPIEAIEDIFDYEEITQELANTGDFFALKVKGDSMEPKIIDKDIVIIKQQITANNGDIVVVMVNGYDATLKRIKIEDNGLWLIPDNQNYGSVFYTAEQVEKLPVRILGKAIEIRRPL